jgi:hypothetical protein
MYFYIVIVALTIVTPIGYLSVRRVQARRGGNPAPRIFDHPFQVGTVIALSWIAYAFASQVCFHAASLYVLERDGRAGGLPTFEEARELSPWLEWLPPSALMVHRNDAD